jgi:hypothetical protein
VIDAVLLDTHIGLWLDSSSERVRPSHRAFIDGHWRNGGTVFLRLCPETLCGLAKPSDHQSDGGEEQERTCLVVEILPILCQAPAPVEPRERSFDHPTFSPLQRDSCHLLRRNPLRSRSRGAMVGVP